MKKFKLKIFVSFTLFWAFLTCVISGLALYLAPKGRIANWIEWTFLDITKEQWSEIHTVFVTLLLIAGILHLIWFNWKVFWSYVKKRASAGIARRWELLVSIIITLIFAASFVWKLPPVYSLVKLAASIDETYETPENQPPVPHAETFSIENFAESILKMTAEEAMNKLKLAGYPVSDPDIIIEDFAAENGISPQEIFNILQSATEKSTEIQQFSGIGQKTLQVCCDENGVDHDSASARLEAAGIEDAKPEEKMKTIAERYQKTPVELLEIVIGSE
ncbi:MAG: DUF4405 domain-containing protein [FCB group bacterium]|nr:DUF4405 domain-containing protein [FCB group bacterium]